MDEIVTRKQKFETPQQLLHAQATATIQSRKFFASMLLEPLFNLKDGDVGIKHYNLEHNYLLGLNSKRALIRLTRIYREDFFLTSQFPDFLTPPVGGFINYYYLLL